MDVLQRLCDDVDCSLVDEVQVLRPDLDTSRGFLVGAVVFALIVHLGPVSLQELFEMRSARIREDWQPSPGVWSQETNYVWVVRNVLVNVGRFPAFARIAICVRAPFGVFSDVVAVFVLGAGRASSVARSQAHRRPTDRQSRCVGWCTNHSLALVVWAVRAEMRLQLYVPLAVLSNVLCVPWLR